MQASSISKSQPDQFVIASWRHELQRLDDMAVEIKERRQVIQRLINLYAPTPRPRSTPDRRSPERSSRPGPQPAAPGEASKLVLEMLPSSGPGLTQRDLQTRLPRLRANVIGRIIQMAAVKGSAVKEGTGADARYWRSDQAPPAAAD